MRGLIDGGCDLLLVETIFDTLNAKAALVAALDVFDETGVELPLMISVTITDRSGRTLSGQTVEAFWISVAHARPLTVGINCALGAREMRPYLADLARLADTLRQLLPERRPAERRSASTTSSPPRRPRSSASSPTTGLVNIVGGCCGTTPDHIRAIAAGRGRRGAARRCPSRADTFTRYAGLEPLTIRPDSNFQMIGERTNVTGSARFRRLITAGDFAQAADVALDQVRGGANILDVNMDEGMLDSEQAMTRFLNLIATEPEIARAAGHDRQLEVVGHRGRPEVRPGQADRQLDQPEGGRGRVPAPGAARSRRYGAAVVVMAFDEQGQADTAERKVAICERAYRLLTERRGLPPVRHHLRSRPSSPSAPASRSTTATRIDFIEATRRLKAAFPEAKVSGGISNLSFSFRGNDTVREAIHSAFLFHAIRAGLDMGIVNAGQLAVYEDIPPDLLERVEDLLFNRRPDATERLVAVRRHACRARSRKKEADLAWRDGTGRGAPRARARPRHRRLHRGGHRGGAGRRTRGRSSIIEGPADGRHEGGRRPVRRRQDVPAAGGQERAGDEEGRVATSQPFMEADNGGRRRSARRPASCSPPSRATSTTSARTSSASCSAATTTRSSTSA